MKKSLGIILVFTCAFFLTVTAQDTTSLVTQGDNYLAAKQYPEAIITFTKAIKIDSTISEYYFKRGKAYFFLHNDSLALRDYDKAVSLDSKNAPLFFMRGQVRNLLNDKPGAVSDYGKAIELDSNFVRAYVSRGYVFVDLGTIDAALVHFTIAINKNPDQSADVYFARGYCNQTQGFFPQALQDYAKAMEINPKHMDSYLNSGNVYMQMTKYDNAIEIYSKAMVVDPKEARLYYMRGFAYMNKQDKENACIDWKHAIAMGYESAQAYIDNVCNAK